MLKTLKCRWEAEIDLSDSSSCIRREFDEEARVFRLRHRGRAMETFSTWLDRRVDNMMSANEDVSPELRNLAQLPLPWVYEYKRMWAYGNHYRTEDLGIGNPFVTYDSGVACVASTLCQASSTDQRPVEANLMYVGILRRIIQVNYAFKKINLMECSWIKPNVTGNATIRKDEHGFWLIKKNAFQGPRAEPYILPVHASQVNACTV